MMDIIHRQNGPALGAIVVGTFVGVLPLFVRSPPETTFIALLCGMFTVMIGAKRLFGPGRFDPLGFLLCGVLIAVTPHMPLAGAAWIKLVAGAGIAMLGLWLYVSALPNGAAPEGGTAPSARDRWRQMVRGSLLQVRRSAAALWWRTTSS